MTASELDAASREMAQARLQARKILSLPASWLPLSLVDAYRLQHAVAVLLGQPKGWKVSALGEAQQRALGVSCPVAAPLLAPWVRDSGAVFGLPDFVAPLLECEFAFQLSRDLPVRDRPYSRTEVEAAIANVRPAVEVVDSRLPAASAPMLELADDFNNGAFVMGTAHEDWRSLAYGEHAIQLRALVDGRPRELARGNGMPILQGDPVAAVLAMANAQPGIYGGLQAGQVITTGTCTGAVHVPGSCDIEADFGVLGVVRMRFDSQRSAPGGRPENRAESNEELG